MSVKILSYLFLIQSAVAQLSGKVGPSTSYTTKASTKTCNVLDYGAKTSGTADIGPIIQKAWTDCAKGGLVYIPPGTYGIQTQAALKGGSASAIQLDGTIYRNGDINGSYFISLTSCTDFEFFSGNSKGAIQGYGYEYLENGNYGARMMRFTNVNHFSVHGIAFVDSPSYYVVFDTCSNGEIFNLILRGISTLGETDGIDVWGSNMWIHDVEVTNGDECVTVKSPASNMLIESIYCNLSGGTAIGSLGTGTDISNIYYRNLYMNRADACYLKTNNGDGTVTDITWDTVIVHGGAYILAVNEAWGSSSGSTGVQINNLRFTNWHGYNSDNSRPTIRLECDTDVPCYNVTVDNVNLWTSDGSSVKWSCENSFGTGACLRAGDVKADVSAYTSVSTISKAPLGRAYTTSTMAGDLTTDFPTTKSFTIPAIPTSFYPGQRPSSSLLNLNGAGGLGKVKRNVQAHVPVPTL
ncbi:MAG: hypothetical protein M1820_007810 [Bogoriella megaspora]|nr:MAG: hypothetical protein M1820_007810 [Bogoriella megaspora]